MSTLRLQTDGICRGQEHALPAVRQAFRRRAPAAGRDQGEAAGNRRHGASAINLCQRVEGLWNRPRITSVACFDCGTRQELNSAATSTICPSCSVHMDLRDYKINTAFSRTIRTHGEVHVTSSGDLSSSSVVCRSAIIEGKLRGSLQCARKRGVPRPGQGAGKVERARGRDREKGRRAVFPPAASGIDRDSREHVRRDRGRDGRHDPQHRLARWQRRRALDQRGKRRHLLRPIGDRPEEAGSRPNCFRMSKRSKPAAGGKVRRPPPHPFGLPATS